MLITTLISSNRSTDKNQFKMKFLLIVSCLVLYVAYTCGQRCDGLPRTETQDCNGGKHEGVNRLQGCTRPSPNNEMWWYNRQNNECFKLSYRGCGGNRNRYCTRQSCIDTCRRRRT